MAELIFDDAGTPAPAYSLDRFEAEIASMRPTFADTWIVPALCMYAAWRTRGSRLGVWTRRMLFTAGVYMLYRNWPLYKQAPAQIAAALKEGTQ